MLVQLARAAVRSARAATRRARVEPGRRCDLHDQLGNQIGEWADLVPSALLSTAVSALHRGSGSPSTTRRS
jgi:hypothetical protein